MKEIQLTKGYKAKVDDSDYEMLSRNKWLAQTFTNISTVYAARRKNRRYELMHRVIMGVSESSIHVDHKNHDGLDNTRENLRIATPSQNLANQNKQRRKTQSRFKGVSLRCDGKKWCSRIKVNQKAIHLGSFSNQNEAAQAYNNAALEHFGEFALLNEVTLR